MTTRTITGTLHHLPDTPWAAAELTFRLMTAFADADTTFPTETITVTTDEDGAFSQALAVPDVAETAARYRCDLPNGAAFLFNLADGVGAVTLESLVVLALTTTDPNNVLTIFDAHTTLTTTAHGGIVASGDARLSDARTPTAHTQAWSTITATPTTLAGYGIVDGGGVAGVTSVGLSLPALFDVTGTPVTTTGVLAATLANQSANTVLAGPTTGIAATPTLRALVAADTPAAAILASANVFTAAQTIQAGAALGIVITGAAASGTPSIATTAPTQAVGATAGTPLQITASPAIAGSATVGAAAGGSVTITAGSAARLTSGNARGGEIFLTPGAGIGTGLAGAVLLSQSVSNTQGNGGLAFGANATDGSALNIQAFNSNFNFYSQNLQVGRLGYALGFVLLSTSGGYSFSTNIGNDGARDLALYRNAAAVVEVNTGTAGQWGALKAGTRDTSTGAVTNGLTLGHQISTGTPGSGMGAGILFNLNSSTTADQNAAQIAALWPDAAGATHATRSGAVSVSTVSIAGALTERLRVDAGVVAGSAVAGTVGLMVWDVDGAALKRVSVGANDSGGAGYKLLRIAN